MNGLVWWISVLLWLSTSPNLLPGSPIAVAGTTCLDTFPVTLSQGHLSPTVNIPDKNQIPDRAYPRVVRALLTSATTSAFNAETRRLSAQTKAYEKIIYKLMSGNERAAKRFVRLQNKILSPYQKLLEDKIAGLYGVTVKFGPAFLGSWAGHLEPSFNMVLYIKDSAATQELSSLLIGLAERTSQNAFILEENSEFIHRMPLTEYSEDGYLHYPQIRVHFTEDLTIPEKAHIARILHHHDLLDFSVGEDYFFISILDFEDDPKIKADNFDRIRRQIERAVHSIKRQLDCETDGKQTVLHRKSLYVAAIQSENPFAQSKTYERKDVFDPVRRITKP